MGNVKQKPFRQMQAHTLRHKQTYPRIIQAYSGILKTLCNSGIFRIVIYPEPWHIQNQKHVQNPGILKTPIYSECWHIQNPRHIWLFQKKSKWWGGGWEYGISRGIKEIACGISRGYWKMNISKGDHKKWCGISRGLCFWPWNFRRI